MVTTTNSLAGRVKKIGDPSASYESMRTLWDRARSVLNGQESAIAHDEDLDVINYTNLLIPFSPSMTQAQYNFLKAEAELPGLVGQYAKMLVSGLLRKKPSLVLGEAYPPESYEWLTTNFTADGRSMVAFLGDAVWEELSSSRAWVSVDFPSVDMNKVKAAERKKYRPYPILWDAEKVINWYEGPHPKTGLTSLLRWTVRFIEQEYDHDTGHGNFVEKVVDYKINETGTLEILHYRKNSEAANRVVGGEVLSSNREGDGQWTQLGETIQPKIHGSLMDFIPAWPLNGSIAPKLPMLQPLIDREVALYNKVTRRNHLLLGAGTYTPYVKSDMDDNEFAELVNSGLGSWLKVGPGDDLGVLEPPTDALQDYDRAIEATISEMTRMGIRLLSPETAESGVALEIRNAATTAQLSALNTQISETMERVIALMLLWRYNVEEEELEFTLSSDFNPTPLGADWLRLVTEWYSAKIIPRSAFLSIVKQNDLLPEDYNDEEAVQEIEVDTLIPSAPQFQEVEVDQTL